MVDSPQAEEWFQQWKFGKTGFPWIDALMRQLWQEAGSTIWDGMRWRVSQRGAGAMCIRKGARRYLKSDWWIMKRRVMWVIGSG